MESLPQVLAIVFVLALAVGLVALKNKRLPRLGFGLHPRTAGRIEVLERVMLTPQHGLSVVRAGGVVLLLATHPGGCTLLRTLEAAGPAAGLRAPGEL